MEKEVRPELIKSFISHLPGFADCNVEYVREGYSTEVYVLRSDKGLSYFRCFEDQETASPQVLAHQLLLERGVIVPKILLYEDNNPDLGHSFIITGQIPGRSIRKLSSVEDIVREAGRQLAVLNTVPVTNFGWIDTDHPAGGLLTGLCHDYHDFMFDPQPDLLKSLVGLGILTQSEADRDLGYLKEHEPLLSDYRQATLAHGDFSSPHIFCDQGKYSGIIDLGDIRGTSIYHDLAHFKVFEPDSYLDLLQGYREVTQLPTDFQERVDFESLMIAVGKLWYRANKMKQPISQAHPAVRAVRSILS